MSSELSVEAREVFIHALGVGPINEPVVIDSNGDSNAIYVVEGARSTDAVIDELRHAHYVKDRRDTTMGYTFYLTDKGDRLAAELGLGLA
jgi:hypothetical protein